jgi:plastocyanin
MGSGASDTGSASNDHVTIKGYAFHPNPITVPAGATVTWENDDSTQHTATASDGSFDTGTIRQGDPEPAGHLRLRVSVPSVHEGDDHG